MYERVLDERQVARDIVDSIRSSTDAPLHTCIDAAKTCIAVMAPFIQDDAFARIQSAVQNYVISLKDCYDYRLLSEIKERTTRIFNEKVEDQNDLVRYQGLCCIKSLVNACPSLIPFLLNSRLPEVLALQFQTQSASLSNLHLTAIKLLAIIYSTNREPPLSHFDFFDSGFFVKILMHLEDQPADIMDFVVNFSYISQEGYQENAVIAALQSNPNPIFGQLFVQAVNKQSTEGYQENAVIAALQSNPNPIFGQLFVQAVNKQSTDRRLKFFVEICRHDGLCKELFYENDLDVLSHVVARELVNSDSVEVRSRCLECIAPLAEFGHCDQMVREAVENCDLDEESRLKTLAFINEQDSHL
ncbi:unnamed protein product [Nippostrongylus brasiliensis]|uniref:NCK-interacting protein with SH3 domain (inferred by orthology to a human protein) n=1 Tax=Nippostrongylus brasiliensis TaxID=27835 RepID=A0A0N4YY95_NIPBR|nr:unnamed protein product [Nippostrongylus brasiliensis]